MKLDEKVLENGERVAYSLGELYRKYGYVRYKISKFEEYDLYVQNKSFLVSENVLTFTDTDGKLMALKPDVTLSIVKNSIDEKNSIQKVYYNENVYRTSVGAGEFKEIMQTGLECIGDIDSYSVGEVVMLAAKSLESVSKKYVLDLSHLGFVSALLEGLTDNEVTRRELLRLMGDKNIHSIRALCAEAGIAEDGCDDVCKLAKLYGPIAKTLDDLLPLVRNDEMRAAYEELATLVEIIRIYGFEDRVFLDFSIVNDMNYYNGIIFKGFVDGIPSGLLSGGRYDNLLKKMGKSSGAIGFAVYLDLLERFGDDGEYFDVDVLLTYEEATTKDIIDAVKLLSSYGKTVKVQKTNDGRVRYRQLAAVRRGGFEILENND
jgi:ATP phosphoribosyltransferase regulatory subunit